MYLLCLSPSSDASAKTAPLNINKVSSSLLNFGRKLIAPAIAGGSGAVSPINSEVHGSSIPGPVITAPPPRPMSEAPSTNAPLQTQSHPQSPHYRLLKSESMPVHLSKGRQGDARCRWLISRAIPIICATGLGFFQSAVHILVMSKVFKTTFEQLKGYSTFKKTFGHYII